MIGVLGETRRFVDAQFAQEGDERAAPWFSNSTSAAVSARWTAT